MSFSNSTSKIALATLLLSLPFSAQSQTTDNNDEIVITSARILGGSPEDAITGITILSGDELDNRLTSTIGETLKYEPGVSSTFFGAGASRPLIRGQSGNRIRVLANGIDTIDASSASPDHAVAVEPAQAKVIEILKGPAILRFGSSGSGGVINVIDGRIPTEIPKSTQASARIGFSSVDSGKEGAASIEQSLGNNLVLHLDGTWRETKDYRIPGFAESEIFHENEEDHDEDHDEGHDEDHDEEREGEMKDRLENSFTKTASITGGLSYISNKGFIGISVHQLDSEYGIPGGHAHHDEDHDEDHDEEEELVSIDLKQTRIDLNAVRKLGGYFERLQLFAGYADYEHTEIEGNEIGTVFANEGLEARLELVQNEVNGRKGASGIHIRKRDFNALGAEAFVPQTDTREIGIYTFQEQSYDNLHLRGAMRFENNRIISESLNQKKSYGLFSVSAGSDYHFNSQNRLGLTAFRSERAPTSEELFSNGPHLATDAYEIGDANLDKETALGVELAYRFKTNNYFLTANAFVTDYQNYIYTDITTEQMIDGLDVYNTLSSDAVFKGGEIQGAYTFKDINNISVSIDGLLEYIRAKTTAGNIPRIAPLSVLVGAEAEWKSLKLRTELDYSAKQSKLSAFELPTESFAQLNGFLTWTPEFNQNVKFKLSALNLFDKEVRQHSSYLKDVVPLPGRNFRFSIKTTF